MFWPQWFTAKRAFGNLYTLLRGQNSNRLEGGGIFPQLSRATFQETFHSPSSDFTRFKCDFTKLHTRVPVNSLVAAERSTEQLVAPKDSGRRRPRKAKSICSTKSCHSTSPRKSYYPQCVMSHECLLNVVMQHEPVESFLNHAHKHWNHQEEKRRDDIRRQTSTIRINETMIILWLVMSVSSSSQSCFHFFNKNNS